MPGFGLFPVDSLERYSKIHEHHFQAVKNHWFIEDYLHFARYKYWIIINITELHIFKNVF